MIIEIQQGVLLALYRKGYYRYRSQIRKICSSLQNPDWSIFDLILKNKMAATGISLSVMKSVYIFLIIGPRGLVCQTNL